MITIVREKSFLNRRWRQILSVSITGYPEPEMPYFCMNEYKKDSDPNGDPKGQTLIAMLVAQHLHANTQPVFGLYVVGRQWRFMLLEKNQYIISNFDR